MQRPRDAPVIRPVASMTTRFTPPSLRRRATLRRPSVSLVALPSRPSGGCPASSCSRRFPRLRWSWSPAPILVTVRFPDPASIGTREADGRTGRPRWRTDPRMRSRAVPVRPVLRGRPRSAAARPGGGGPGPGIDREGGGSKGRFFHRNPPPASAKPPPLISAGSLGIRDRWCARSGPVPGSGRAARTGTPRRAPRPHGRGRRTPCRCRR